MARKGRKRVERNVKIKQKQQTKQQKKKSRKKRKKKYSLLMIPCAFFEKVKNKDLYLPKLYGGRHAYKVRNLKKK